MGVLLPKRDTLRRVPPRPWFRELAPGVDKAGVLPRRGGRQAAVIRCGSGFNLEADRPVRWSRFLRQQIDVMAMQMQRQPGPAPLLWTSANSLHEPASKFRLLSTEIGHLRFTGTTPERAPAPGNHVRSSRLRRPSSPGTSATLFNLGPLRLGQLRRTDELVGEQLLHRRNVFHPHIGFDALRRGDDELRVHEAQPVLPDRRHRRRARCRLPGRTR